MKWPKGPSRCKAGHIQIDWDSRFWTLKFYSCDRCDVVVWPYFTRWADPTWWKFIIKSKIRDIKYWFSRR